MGPTLVEKLATSLGVALTPSVGGQYALPCEQVANLPPLRFVIGGVPFELAGEEYTMRLEAFGQSACVLGVMGMDLPSGVMWILGDVFLSR